MRELDQVMTKLKVRRAMEQILDSDISQADIEEEDEIGEDGRSRKRLTIVIRYVPA